MRQDVTETQQRFRQNDPPILKIFSGTNATRHQTILNQLWVTIDCIAHTQSCWIFTPPKHTIWLSEWTKPKSLQSMEGHYEPYPMGACECGVYPMPQDIPHLPNFYNVDKFGRYNKWKSISSNQCQFLHTDYNILHMCKYVKVSSEQGPTIWVWRKTWISVHDPFPHEIISNLPYFGVCNYFWANPQIWQVKIRI